jgi:hypothetical protein
MKASAQERIPYPEKKKDETENAWKVRVAGGGETARYLTPAQIRARKEWQLYKMHAPDTIYNPDKHLFDLNNPFPAFYGEPRCIEDIEDKKEKKRVLELFQKNPKLLAGLRPLDERDDPLSTDDGVIFVAFNPNMELTSQLRKAAAFLNQYQKIFPKPMELNRFRRNEWVRYLRMLDAEIAEGKGLSHAEKIKVIVPSRKNNPYPEVNGYAYDTLKAARKMANSGFNKLLLNIAMN